MVGELQDQRNAAEGLQKSPLRPVELISAKSGGADRLIALRSFSDLGMASSPSFVREPEGNGAAERFIRTRKENPVWVKIFANVAELVEALREFKRRYNERWLIERHGFRTSSQVRAELTGSARAVA
jgi:transposase InsO family protein